MMRCADLRDLNLSLDCALSGFVWAFGIQGVLPVPADENSMTSLGNACVNYSLAFKLSN